MGTQKLKAAVISAGMIANSGHIPAYKAFSQDVSLEAVCDLNASAARDTAPVSYTHLTLPTILRV